MADVPPTEACHQRRTTRAWQDHPYHGGKLQCWRYRRSVTPMTG